MIPLALNLLPEHVAETLEYLRQHRLTGKERLKIDEILGRIGWLHQKGGPGPTREKTALLWLLCEYLRMYALDIGILLEPEEESIAPKHMRLRAASYAVPPRKENPKMGS